MNVLREFGRHAPNAVFLSLILGLFAGMFYVGLIPLVISSIEAPQGLQYQTDDTVLFLGFQVSNSKIAMAFFILCFLILIMRTLSQVILARVSVQLTTEMRKRIYRSINGSAIDELEQIGAPKLINALTMDVGRIMGGAHAAPQLLINGVTIVGMLTFIWLTHPNVFHFVITGLFFGVVTYQIPMLISGRYHRMTRELMDDLQEGFRAIIYGAKELKLNNNKQEKFLENDILQVEKNIKKNSMLAATISTTAINYGDMLSFLVIGLLAFVFVNYHQVGPAEIVSIIMILLYLSGPVTGVLESVPDIIMARISYNRMEQLLQQMSSEKVSPVSDIEPQWQRITFKDVTYQYEGLAGFMVGPVNITLRKGEVAFIVGGNGSGKSTFSKLVSLHYRPDAGEIYFDDTLLNEDNISDFRQQVFAIYSDYYLFKSIYSMDRSDPMISQRINELLIALGLDKKVSVVDGQFSTLELSDGQRRRLALLVAFIEDKQLYLFDEWAADQDPHFREVFYRQILPDLKKKGKAVVVISHDDRYFDAADQLIKLESGKQIPHEDIHLF